MCILRGNPPHHWGIHQHSNTWLSIPWRQKKGATNAQWWHKTWLTAMAIADICCRKPVHSTEAHHFERSYSVRDSLTSLLSIYRANIAITIPVGGTRTIPKSELTSSTCYLHNNNSCLQVFVEFRFQEHSGCSFPESTKGSLEYLSLDPFPK